MNSDTPDVMAAAPAAAAAASTGNPPPPLLKANNNNNNSVDQQQQQKQPKKKKKKNKTKAPPYKEYHVVTAPLSNGNDGKPPSVIRPVNAFDVLLLKPSEPNGGYDYNKVPGNLKYRKLVDLSQSNFDSMTNNNNNNNGNNNNCDKNQGRQELAQSVADTIRNDWGGLFLRRLHPNDANCTQWIDIGSQQSVLEVSAKFQSNFSTTTTTWSRNNVAPVQIKVEKTTTTTDQQEEVVIKEEAGIDGQQQQLQKKKPSSPPPGIVDLQQQEQPQQQHHIEMPPPPIMPPPPAAPATTPATPMHMVERLGGRTPPSRSILMSPGIAFVRNMPSTPAMPPLLVSTAQKQQQITSPPPLTGTGTAAAGAETSPAPPPLTGGTCMAALSQQQQQQQPTLFSPQAPNMSSMPGVVITATNPTGPKLKPPPPRPPAGAGATTTTNDTAATEEQHPSTTSTTTIFRRKKRGRPKRGDERPQPPPGPPKPKRPRGRPRKDGSLPKPSQPGGQQGGGGKKKVHVPPMRFAKSVVPLKPSPNRLRDNVGTGGAGTTTLMLSPPGKEPETTNFQLDEQAGIGVAHHHHVAPSPGLLLAELPPLEAAGLDMLPPEGTTTTTTSTANNFGEDSGADIQQQEQQHQEPQGHVLIPAPKIKKSNKGKKPVLKFRLPDTPNNTRKTNVTLISPPKPSLFSGGASSFPFPPPPTPQSLQVKPDIEQAKKYLRVKDPEWMTRYYIMAYVRANMYINGWMKKWTAGQVRHVERVNDTTYDTNLLEWCVDQQTMYKEYCAWEEAKYQEQFGPTPTEKEKQAEEEEAGATKLHALAAMAEYRQKQEQGEKKNGDKNKTKGGSNKKDTTGPEEAHCDTAKASKDKNETSSQPSKPKRTKKVVSKRKVAPNTTKDDNTKGKPKKKLKKQSKKGEGTAADLKTGKPASKKTTTKGKDPPKKQSSKIDGKKNEVSKSAAVGQKENNGVVSGSREEDSKKKEPLKDISTTTTRPTLEPSKQPLKEVQTNDPSSNNKSTTPSQSEPCKETKSGTDMNGGSSAMIVVETSQHKGGQEEASRATSKGENETVDVTKGPPLEPQAGAAPKKTNISQKAPAIVVNQAAQKPVVGGNTNTAAEIIDPLEEAKRIAEERRITKLREVQRAKILLLDDLRFVWLPTQEPPMDAPDDWKESFYDLRDYVRTRGDTAVSDGVELGVWAQLQRKKFQRSLEIMAKQASAAERGGNAAADESLPEPPLSRGQMAALRALGFDWDDLESSQFYMMYLKLLEFKNRVGDCLVPYPDLGKVPIEGVVNEEEETEDGDLMVETKSDPKLFFWVQRQRYEYARLLRNKEREEHRAAGVDDDGHRLVQELLIQDRREQRKGSNEPKANDNDDCTVVCDLVGSPQASSNKNNANHGKAACKDKGKVGLKERRGRKKKPFVPSSEQVSTLTEAHIAALNGAGFLWNTDITSNWIRQYRRLHAFHKTYGHSVVTHGNNTGKTKLHRWTSQVRQLYQRNMNGEKGGLSEDKLSLLRRLDFKFQFDELAERRPWHERIEWLRQFKEEHGHVDVPQKHPTLGHFVKRLRKEYDEHQRGGKKMNPEKLKQLTDLGFKWRVRLKRVRRRKQEINHDDEEESSSSGSEEEEDVDDDDDEEEEEDRHDNQDGSNQAAENGAIMDPTNHVAKIVLQKTYSPGSSNQCSACFSTILFPSAKCGGCFRGFCQDCFDEILHCNDQICSSCRGVVNPTSAGWGL